MPYTLVKDLPQSLQSALSATGYNRKDIRVEAAETWQAASAGGDGYRAFLILVNLSTGETQSHIGSWGGANMFNPSNAVDLDTTSRPLPEGFAVIHGSSGGGKPVYASIDINPSNIAPLLSTSKAELTDRQRWIVTTIARYNSGGRKREFTEYGRISPTEAEFEELARLGYIKKTKTGISITVEGRNAADAYPKYPKI